MKTQTRDKILEIIKHQGQIRVHDLISELNLSPVAVHKQLKKLFLEGKIRKVGRPPLVCYRLNRGKKVIYFSHMDTKVLNYRIIIEPEKYTDGSRVYVAHCPTLGVSDYGDSVEAVLTSIKDGIELAVESLEKKNQEVPADKLEDQIIASASISLA